MISEELLSKLNNQERNTFDWMIKFNDEDFKYEILKFCSCPTNINPVSHQLARRLGWEKND